MNVAQAISASNSQLRAGGGGVGVIPSNKLK